MLSFIKFYCNRLGALNKNGIIRPFDKDGAGYTRSEAVNVVFLQKARDAKRIYANVVLTKTNNDGFKTQGLTYPNHETQVDLLNSFYEQLQMDPRAVGFVEAHGTSTIAGDLEECLTLDSVYRRDREHPLLVGSVKSNLGHSEGASGLVSVIKVLISFENQLIPPNINYIEPRANIPSLVEGRLKVVTEAEKLPNQFAAVNSFGLGGANAHVLLRTHEKEKVNFGLPDDYLPRLLVWSGRTVEAVETIFKTITDDKLDAEFLGLLQNTQTISNSSNIHKGYAIFTQAEKDGKAICLGQDVKSLDGVRRPIVWVYSGN